MDIQLQRGLQAPGNDFIQRQVLEAIILDGYFAGIPPLDYLCEKLATTTVTLTPAQAEEPKTYKCSHPACADRAPFKNQLALNGHMKAHAQLNN